MGGKERAGWGGEGDGGIRIAMERREGPWKGLCRKGEGTDRL